MKPKWTYEKLKQWEAQWALKCFEWKVQEQGAITPDQQVQRQLLESVVHRNPNNNPNSKNN